MTDRTLVLNRNQVFDAARGPFYLGLKILRGRKYLGLPVHEDCTGRRLVIRDAR